MHRTGKNQMKHKLLIIAALFAFSAHAEVINPIEAKERIAQIFACTNRTTPEEVVSLMAALGGKAIVMTSPYLDAEYTLPNPIEVFGKKVQNVSIHQKSNLDGSFTEYTALSTGDFELTTQIAGVAKDAFGRYRSEIGGNDLSLVEREDGAIEIICGNSVRTPLKSISRTLKSYSEPSVAL